MKDRIQALEKESKSLEPGSRESKNLLDKSINYTSCFLQTIDSQKAYTRFDDSVNSLLKDPISEEPSGIENVLDIIEKRIVSPGLNTASGKHFGYIPGGGLLSSAVGDYITAITNRYAGIYFSSPGAVALETRLINWMAELIGFEDNYGGYLASGGSMANLTAVVTAREQAELKPEDTGKAVVYLSEQTHHCVDRALMISGMSHCVKRYISLDSQSRMKSKELQKTIQNDKDKGLNPWMIVASAGTTDTGAVDPLEEIAAISTKENLWYHIDAAYGGFFMLTEEGRKKLRGINLADSVVLDPHKGLFLPYGSGALVVRDVEKLAATHRYEANYMQDTKIEVGMYSPAELSPELSKHFRGLRMWMPLKIHGVKAFRSALQEKLLLTRYTWEKLNEMEEIELGAKPDLTVFTFRWVPRQHENLDELNSKLHKKILDDGSVFLSSTQINGEFQLRFVVLSVRTHLKEIEEFLKVLAQKMNEIRGEYSW